MTTAIDCLTTFAELTRSRLESLCRSAGFDADAAIDVCETLLGPTGHRPVGRAPEWKTSLSDDGTPVELSLALEGSRAEPRLLVESLGENSGLLSRWDAGCATNERLKGRYGVSLDRFALVQDLFRPKNESCLFAMWHAAWLRVGRAPLFKMYLNPAADGTEKAPAVVKEALHRLGFGSAWNTLQDVLSRRARNHIIYFSLDLEAGAAARVKVYVAHPGAHASDIEPLLAFAPGYAKGEVERFCRALTGTDGPYNARPLQTCYAFTADSDAGPSSVTLHLPIRSYTGNDRVALERISDYLGGEVGANYRRIIEETAHRPLEQGTGFQTYASFCAQDGARRANAYLAVEAYAVEPPREAARAAAHKAPIGYDYHDPRHIELYYALDARTGKHTCMAACEHCFLRENEIADNFKQDISEAVEIMTKLRNHGFQVTPAMSDTFAENGAYLRAELLRDVRFILGKMAWTSGMPLLKGDYRELLQLAVDNGIEIISMTSHGREDGESPLRGVVPPSQVREVVRLIRSFNKERSQNLRISLTFTIGAWNFSRDRIRSYFEYCEELGVDMLRLNNYCDNVLEHPERCLSREQTIEFYSMAKEIYDRHPGNLKLSVAEDFGKWGIAAMGFPAEVGDCAAGRHLFGVLYPTVYACPQLCNMPVGRVNPDGSILWDEQKLKIVRDVRQHREHSGCVAVSWANSAEIRDILKPVVRHVRPRR